MYNNDSDFYELLWQMNAELSPDFPYKNEMLMLRYGFDSDCAAYRSVLEEFEIDSEYIYHPTAYYTMILVSLIPIENGDFSLMSKLRYDTYELLCQQMERDGYYLEAQKLHFLLLVIYQLQNNEKKMKYHIRKGLELAMDHELYFGAAFYERLYKVPIDKILKDFPKEFANKIQYLGNVIHKGNAKFLDSGKNPSYLSILSSNEFEYAFLANQGYTNREIAQSKKISEKIVSRKYSEIYDKLGVKSKQELIDLINKTHKMKI